MRLSALGNSGDPVENAARREELENLHGIIDGTQYNIAEVEAMPYTAANRLKSQRNARRAALKALLEAKSKPGYKSRYAVENMTNEENYSAMPTYAAAPAPAPAPIMAAFSPPRKYVAPKGLNYSPGLRVDYVWENNTPRTARYRHVMGSMMEQRNREMTMAALSPHTRATTAPQYPFAPARQIYQAEESPKQHSVGKTLTYPLPGQSYITNYFRRAGGRRRSTKYIKRRIRSLQPKHSTRKHRKF